MIIKIKTLIYRENFMSTETFTYFFRRISTYEPHHEKTNICTCKNKDADQLRGNHEADQRLCFRYMDSKIPPLSKSEIFSL